MPDSRFIAYLPCKTMKNASYPALHSAMADSAPALAAVCASEAWRKTSPIVLADMLEAA